jgi:hypothetical protein
MASAQSLQRPIGWRVSMQARGHGSPRRGEHGDRGMALCGWPMGIVRCGGAFDLWPGEIASMKGNLRSGISFYFKSGLSDLF